MKELQVFWTEFDPAEREKSIRDPLGLQNMAEILADEILPGLTSRTTRARYFSFLCWGISVIKRHADQFGMNDYNSAEETERLLLILEKLFALAIVGRYSGKQNVPSVEKPFFGIDLADEHFQKNKSQFPLGDKYRFLQNPRFQGCFGAYKSSLVDLGFVDPSNLQVTKGYPESGESLGLAFCKDAKIENLVCKVLISGQISIINLKKLGQVFELNPRKMKPKERTILDNKIKHWDTVRAQTFGAFSALQPSDEISCIENAMARLKKGEDLERKLSLIKLFEFFSLASGGLFEKVLKDMENNQITSLEYPLTSTNKRRASEELRKDPANSAATCLYNLENIRAKLKQELLPYVDLFGNEYTGDLSEFIHDILNVTESSTSEQNKLDEVIKRLISRHRSIKRAWSWVNEDPLTRKAVCIRPTVNLGLAHSYRIRTMLSLNKELSGGLH